MPIYEYRCQSCGHELERLQRMSDAALTDCPECGKSALKRLVSAAGFRLKGAGWYETDFKKSNQRNLVDSGSDKSASSGPAAESASESSRESSRESSGESAKGAAKESAKESKSSDSSSSKSADKHAQSGTSASTPAVSS